MFSEFAAVSWTMSLLENSEHSGNRHWAGISLEFSSKFWIPLCLWQYCAWFVISGFQVSAGKRQNPWLSVELGKWDHSALKPFNYLHSDPKTWKLIIFYVCVASWFHCFCVKTVFLLGGLCSIILRPMSPRSQHPLVMDALTTISVIFLQRKYQEGFFSSSKCRDNTLQPMPIGQHNALHLLSLLRLYYCFILSSVLVLLHSLHNCLPVIFSPGRMLWFLSAFISSVLLPICIQKTITAQILLFTWKRLKNGKAKTRHSCFNKLQIIISCWDVPVCHMLGDLSTSLWKSYVKVLLEKWQHCLWYLYISPWLLYSLLPYYITLILHWHSCIQNHWVALT